MSEKEIKKVSPEMDRMKEKGKKTNRASVESQAGREMTTGEGGGGGLLSIGKNLFISQV